MSAHELLRAVKEPMSPSVRVVSNLFYDQFSRVMEVDVDPGVQDAVVVHVGFCPSADQDGTLPSGQHRRSPNQVETLNEILSIPASLLSPVACQLRAFGGHVGLCPSCDQLFPRRSTFD